MCLASFDDGHFVWSTGCVSLYATAYETIRQSVAYHCIWDYITAVHETGCFITAVHETGCCITAVHETACCITAVHETGCCITAVHETGCCITAVHETGCCITAVHETGSCLPLDNPEHDRMCWLSLATCICNINVTTNTTSIHITALPIIQYIRLPN